MRIRLSVSLLNVAYLLIFISSLLAQDLGPEFRKIKDGIYVESTSELSSNCGIILTEEGVVLIDSGFQPTDSLAVLRAVRKLTPLPVRFLIDTEPHRDHTTGHFVHSPPAIIIAHEGAAEEMKKEYGFEPERIERLREESPEMREALQGYRMVTPPIEYRDRLTLKLGERTFELLHLKNVHSTADTVVWLPKERVLFAGSGAIPNSFNRFRPFVTIPEMLDGIKRLKSLNPEIVVPGHGPPGTTKIFDDSERYYGLLLERVGKMVREGKSLDQIKQDLRMPEYDHWLHKERIPENIEAAYRAVKAGYNSEH